jgi:hypothetical protein
MAFDPLAFAASLGKLWTQGSYILWALACACMCASVGAEAVGILDAEALTAVGRGVPLWFFIAGLALSVLAAFKRYQERHERTLSITPDEQRSNWHLTTATDGSRTTQVVVHLDVVNLTKRVIWMTEVGLTRPRVAVLLLRIVQLRNRESGTYGSYGLPPEVRTQAFVHFLAEGDYGDALRKKGVRIEVADQFGHWHRLSIEKLRGA